MIFDFLIDTYETERLKTLSVWHHFMDEDLPVRPNEDDGRGRSVHEQMVHQCVSENLWFVNLFHINVGAPPLPVEENRDGFIERYAEDSGKRLSTLRDKDEAWWMEIMPFFTEPRSRAWIMTRRIAHSAHHRGQLTTMLRMLNRPLYSTYGPTADTGGLMQNNAPTIYMYKDIDANLTAMSGRARLPGPPDVPVTERPND